MIGTLNESPLHQALKTYYARAQEVAQQQLVRDADTDVGPAAHTEVAVAGYGYVADVLCGQQIVEIQTGGLGALRRKLMRLLDDFRILVVYPIATRSYIVKLSQQGDGTFTRRRSPKRGSLLNLLDELVSIPELLLHPNFELEVVLVEQEVIREFAPKLRRRRGGWRTVERHLLNVEDTHRFSGAADLWQLIERAPEEPFDTADLAEGMGANRSTAQKFAYCMKAIGEIEVVGKNGNSRLYRRCGNPQ